MSPCDINSFPVTIITHTQQKGGGPTELTSEKTEEVCVSETKVYSVAEEALRIVAMHLSTNQPSKDDEQLSADMAVETINRTIPLNMKKSKNVTTFLNILLANIPNSEIRVVDQSKATRWTEKGKEYQPIATTDDDKNSTYIEAFIESVQVHIDAKQNLLLGRFIFNVEFNMSEETDFVSRIGIEYNVKENKTPMIINYHTEDVDSTKPRQVRKQLGTILKKEYKIRKLLIDQMKGFIKNLEQLRKNQPGGTSNIIHLLGRRRKIVTQGRKLFVRYNNEMISLTKAKQLDNKMKKKLGTKQ